MTQKSILNPKKATCTCDQNYIYRLMNIHFNLQNSVDRRIFTLFYSAYISNLFVISAITVLSCIHKNINFNAQYGNNERFNLSCVQNTL